MPIKAERIKRSVSIFPMRLKQNAVITRLLFGGILN